MNQYSSEEPGRDLRCRPPAAAARGCDGLFVVDKPSGISSFEVVRRIRKATRARRVGHTGTLDPLASGVLPVCVGEATKLASLLASGKRHYRGTFILGVETDTLDITGRILRRQDASGIPTGRIEEASALLAATGYQTPPQFSAIKYKGKPSYYWARRGIKVPLQARAVRIEGFCIRERSGERVSFDLVCSSGTYVRSLVAEIGAALGCGACLSELRRMACGQFCIEDAVDLERLLEALRRDASSTPYLVPMTALLPELGSVPVDQAAAERVRHGGLVPWSAVCSGLAPGFSCGTKVKILHNDSMIALGECRLSAGLPVLAPIRVFEPTGGQGPRETVDAKSARDRTIVKRENDSVIRRRNLS